MGPPTLIGPFRVGGNQKKIDDLRLYKSKHGGGGAKENQRPGKEVRKKEKIEKNMGNIGSGIFSRRKKKTF